MMGAGKSLERDFSFKNIEPFVFLKEASKGRIESFSEVNDSDVLSKT